MPKSNLLVILCSLISCNNSLGISSSLDEDMSYGLASACINLPNTGTRYSHLIATALIPKRRNTQNASRRPVWPSLRTQLCPFRGTVCLLSPWLAKTQGLLCRTTQCNFRSHKWSVRTSRTHNTKTIRLVASDRTSTMHLHSQTSRTDTIPLHKSTSCLLFHRIHSDSTSIQTLAIT
jgi:hypothetical protein